MNQELSSCGDSGCCEAGNKQPDLDEIINQITNNGEFKDMMNSLSNNLKNGDFNMNMADFSNNKDIGTGINDNVDNGDNGNNGDNVDNGDKDDSDNSNNSDNSDNESYDENNLSYYELLTTFFTDNNGNNICEVMSNINENLSSIKEELKLNNKFNKTKDE
jgi:hypothetical protein